ncbi:MAG: S-layer homology domain-containing protein [Filifactor alocis]|nr:S-layer homology domain-containing protein [Filifactor alocis]
MSSKPKKPNTLTKKVGALLLSTSLFLSGFTSLYHATSYAEANTDYRNHWAKQYLERAVQKGYLTGYTDSNIKPDLPIKRAEFVVMINKAFQYEPKATLPNPFQDVSEQSWYADDIKIALFHQYITGTSKNTFAPEKKLTREESSVIIYKLLKQHNISKQDQNGTDIIQNTIFGELPFRDTNKISPWARPFIQSAIREKILEGHNDNTFQPKKPLTRAEAVVIIEKLLSRINISSLENETKQHDQQNTPSNSNPDKATDNPLPDPQNKDSEKENNRQDHKDQNISQGEQQDNNSSTNTNQDDNANTGPGMDQDTTPNAPKEVEVFRLKSVKLEEHPVTGSISPKADPSDIVPADIILTAPPETRSSLGYSTEMIGAQNPLPSSSPVTTHCAITLSVEGKLFYKGKTASQNINLQTLTQQQITAQYLQEHADNLTEEQIQVISEGNLLASFFQIDTVSQIQYDYTRLPDNNEIKLLIPADKMEENTPYTLHFSDPNKALLTHLAQGSAKEYLPVKEQKLTIFKPNKENREDVKLKISTDVYSYDPHLELYYTDQILPLEGTMQNIQNVKKLTLKIYDFKEQLIEEQNIDINTKWSIQSPPLLYGKNHILICAEQNDGKQYTDRILLYNKREDTLSQEFVDKFLYDYEYMQELFQVDTDNDAIPDLREIYNTHSDPLNAMSIQEGISDGDYDSDEDGLSNSEEIQLGLNPLVENSDWDDLPDYDEIRVYHTDALSSDTDEDGASDSWEIENGYDPLTKETDFNIRKTFLPENTQYVKKVNLDIINAQGTGADSLAIEEYEDLLLNKNMPGYLVPAYDITMDATFREASLKLTLDDNLLHNPNIRPVLYYFNEKTQHLEKVDQQLQDNVLTAKLTHFSKYILIDAIEYNLKKHEYEYELEEGNEDGNKDLINEDGKTVYREGKIVMLILDNYFKVVQNDTEHKQKQIAKKIALDLGEKDGTGIIGWKPQYNGYPSGKDNLYVAQFLLYPSREDSSYAIETINSLPIFTGGRFRLEEGLNKMNEIEEWYSGEMLDYRPWAVVFLTDGNAIDYEFDSGFQGVNNPHVHFIDLAKNPQNSKLKVFTDKHRMSYHTAQEFEEDEQWLKKILHNITKNPKDLDSDKDGLSDFEERLISEGKLTFSTGAVIGELDPHNNDSDGDGLTDGQEIEISETIVPIVDPGNPLGLSNISFYRTNSVEKRAKSKAILRVFAKSDPGKIDTDGDGYYDKDDPRPLNKDLYKYLGDEDYMKLIKKVESKSSLHSSGRRDDTVQKILINYMRKDLERNSNIYSQSKKQKTYWNNFCKFFNRQVRSSHSVTKDLHYFRNKLNRIPKTLMRIDGSIYHMHGKDGEYNLKFCSKDGKYEAVYNRDYKLQDETVSPENMGTYNYGSPFSKPLPISHVALDVIPYYNWGNSPEDTISEDLRKKPGTRGKYDSNQDAQLHRTKIIKFYRLITEVKE